MSPPVSPQCEAVQFDMSWKVPAILYYARRNLNASYNLVSECPAWEGVVASPWWHRRGGVAVVAPPW